MKLKIKKLLLFIICLISQIIISIIIYQYLKKYIIPIDISFKIISLIICSIIIRESKGLSYHVPWLLLIMLFPIIGTILFFIIGTNTIQNKKMKELNQIIEKSKKYLKKEALNTTSTTLQYIHNFTSYPITNNNDVKYYSLGEQQYQDILIELKNAKSFIFLESYMINKGVLWSNILKILEEKVNKGVEVRVIYDDMGTSTTLPTNYPKVLQEKGIKCIVFNKIKLFGNIMKNRDHRKIIVVDGKVAFLGGMNLSDEYINKNSKLGHWKDAGVRIKGASVWTSTVMFLNIWNTYQKDDTDYEQYKIKYTNNKNNGYVSIYGENPLDDEVTAEDIYLNIINNSNKYLYIYTPYLIIDNHMLNALTLASKRGVDIKIILPGIPDNKLVYLLSSSYFNILIKGGVKIYKYTPGFIHSKVFLSDDKIATVGSINLDYRSLYLHFESGVYLENINTIKNIKEDIEKTLKRTKEVTLKESTSNIFIYLIQCILRLISPNM